MSVEEKLQTMEAIWENLSCDSRTVESPGWHEEELRVRGIPVASGEAKLSIGKKRRGDPPANFARIEVYGLRLALLRTDPFSFLR